CICFNSEEHVLLFKHQMILCVTVKFGIGGFDVVHVLHGFVQAMEHDFTVSSNHGVSHDGSGIVHVSKIAEVPLGPGVNDKTSTNQNEEKEHFIRSLESQRLLGDKFVCWFSHVHPRDAYHSLLFSSNICKD
uniref:Uncharacterized protein n=1 Tax=Sinocyclocheilus anshuiensis TaxID=1608454 RepID=A0A671QPF7_9TELE